MFVNSPKKFLVILLFSTGKILNVGCGKLILDNAINFDRDSKAGVDIYADFHYMPFKDNTFDTTFAFDVIEHSKNPLLLKEEIERVTKGNVVVECADFDIFPIDWHADIDHKTYINQGILKEIMGRDYKFISLGRGWLIATKELPLFQSLLIRILSLLEGLYRRITFQPKGRATHWR